MPELSARLAQLAELHGAGRLLDGDYVAAVQEEINTALTGHMTGAEVAAAARALRALVAEGLLSQSTARAMAEKLLVKSRLQGLEQPLPDDGEAAIDIGAALSSGWQVARKRFWRFLGVFAVVIAVTAGFEMLPDYFAKQEYAFLAIGLYVAGYMVNMLMQLGERRISLLLADDPAAAFGPANLFREGELLGRYILLAFLVFLMVGLGLILLVIPGIVFALRYSQSFFAMLEDKDAGQAMRYSRELTYGHKKRLCIFYITLFCLNILGLLALGVGLLVTYPMSLVAMGTVYRQLQGRA